MNSKIQGMLTSIYDWIDDHNPIFRFIDKASHICNREEFLMCKTELSTLITKSRSALNDLSLQIEEITVCLNNLHRRNRT